MALARTDRLSGASGTTHGTGSHVSSPFTPSNNSLLVVVEGLTHLDSAGSDLAAAATLSGGGLTWTKRVSVDYDMEGSGYHQALVIWTAPVVTGASMTLTFDAGANNVLGYVYHAFDFTGYDTASPVGATATDDTLADPAGAMTLSGAPASTSIVVASRSVNNDGTGVSTATPGSGWTEVYDTQIGNTFIGIETQVRGSSTSTSVTWTDIDTGAGGLISALGVALEIKASVPVAFDAASESSNLSGSTSGNWNHTCTGSERALVVGLSGWDDGSSLTGVTVTYNGVAMTKLGGWEVAGGNQAVLWGLANPASGTNSIAVANIPAGFSELGGGAVSFTGVDQVTPFGTVVGELDGSVNVTLAAGDMAVDILYQNNDGLAIFPTAGAGQTERVSVEGPATIYHMMSTEAGTGTVTMSWSNGTADFALAAVPVKVSTGAAAAVIDQSRYRFFEDGDELPHFDIVTPDIVAVDATGSLNNTATTTWAIAFPSAVAGDLLIACVSWDDSTTTTTVTPAAGPNGETWTQIGPIASSGTEVRSAVYYTIATGTWSAGNRNFTASALEQWNATVIKVYATEFLASDPIGASGTLASAGTAETSVPSPAFTAEASDYLGRLILFYTSDVDAITAPGSDFTTLRNNTSTVVGHLVGVRNTPVSASESIAAMTATIAGDSWCSIGLVVKPPVATDGRTPIAANNTAISRAPADPFGVSIRIENTGGGLAEDTFKLQYRLNSGSWTDVTGSSSIIRTVATADFVDGADVPEYLFGTGTYVSNNNAALETDGTLVLGANFAAATSFELHANLEVQSSGVVDSDVIQLRVVQEDGTVLNSYTNTPSITVDTSIRVVNTNQSEHETATSSHTVALPSGIVAGNRLLVAIDAMSGNNTELFNTPSGWTEVSQDVWAVSFGGPGCLALYTKIASGSEGASVVITSDISCESSHVSYQIANAHSTDIQAGTFLDGTSDTTPDPNGVTPSWGAEESLWITFAAIAFPAAIPTPPTNYTLGPGITTFISPDNFRLDGAHRVLNASTENPGPWAYTSGDFFGLITIAVRPAGGAPTTISVSGALASQSATMAGTAIKLQATGAVASQSATMAGTGKAIINVTGALASQSATMAGSATTTKFTGVLQAQDSTISGAVGVRVNVTGALTTDPATISGIVTPSANFTGALASGPAQIAGTASAIISVNGSLASQDASMSGTAVRLMFVGSLVSPDATMSGTAQAKANFTGSIVSDPATISGTAGATVTVNGAIVSEGANVSATSGPIISVNGTLQSQSATMTGGVEVVTDNRTFNGALQAQSATISGTATIPALSFVGAFQAEPAIISGTVGATINASGALVSQNASVLGIFQSIFNATGALISSPASLIGTVGVSISVNGALAVQAATLSGEFRATTAFTGVLNSQNATISGVYTPLVGFVGALNSQISSVSGIVGVSINVNGALQAQNALISGTFQAFDVFRVSSGIQAQNSTISGIYHTTELLAVNGNMQAQPATLSLTYTTTQHFASTMQAQSAVVSGEYIKIRVEREEIGVRWLDKHRFRFKVVRR